MPKSDLPFGSEFSPSQIDLGRVLELADQHGDDWRAFEAAIEAEYFHGHDTSDYNRGKLANNTKLGMRAYGLIEADSTRLTEVGRSLFELHHDPKSLYREFARHILLSRHGYTLVQCVQDMQDGGETVDLVKLREWLDERGISFPRGGKHPSIMRLWLEKAGVFTSGWKVSASTVQAILGVSTDDIEALAKLTAGQRAYLKTLANMGDSGPYPSNEVEKLAAATHNIKFNEKSLPKDVLRPLEATGYISLVRGTASPGRGAKPFMVSPTEKLIADVVTPLIGQLEQQTNVDLRPFLRVPLADIIAALEDADAHIRGLALEALAIRLMRLLDMEYRGTRLRGDATGGAEVDVIFENSRLVFSRWQVQCKHKPSGGVSLDDVAKEVGLTHLIYSNVIVMVSTGVIGPQARRYANKIMGDSNLSIVLVDGTDIAAIIQNPAAIVDVFNREAQQAMKLKPLEL